jgi:glycosyltransferase involved in cell wall biosynthesis
MVSAHAWPSPLRLGGRHLAKALVEAGWDVAHVSDPISPFHLLRGYSKLRDRAAVYRNGGVSDLDGHVWAAVPGALATPYDAPLLRSRWLGRNWSRLSFPNIVKLVKAHGFGDVDLIYFDSVIQPFWLSEVNHRRSVFRVGDMLSAFQGVTGTMRGMERELASSVDLVAYSAKTLEPHVIRLGARDTLHLPNGVDVRHFIDGDRSVPDDLDGIPRPIAIYVGAMDVWFDYAAVDALTAALPGVSFVMVGPDALARTRLTSRANLHLLGRRPYDELPRYLHNADVGIIPFDVAGHPALVSGVHPLKLYEYLASGLPVVATRWQEIALLDAPVTLCRTHEEFATSVAAAVRGGHDAADGLRFAQAADWSSRVHTLLGRLFDD